MHPTNVSDGKFRLFLAQTSPSTHDVSVTQQGLLHPSCPVQQIHLDLACLSDQQGVETHCCSALRKTPSFRAQDAGWQQLEWRVAWPAQLPSHGADVLLPAQVPLIVARYAGDAALMENIATAVQLHQSDADALLAAQLFAAILERLTVFGGRLQVR